MRCCRPVADGRRRHARSSERNQRCGVKWSANVTTSMAHSVREIWAVLVVPEVEQCHMMASSFDYLLDFGAILPSLQQAVTYTIVVE